MTGAEVFAAVATTWPPATAERVGDFMVPQADAGGNRVSAARLFDATRIAGAELLQAEATMTAQGRAPLFQVLDHQTPLSAALDQRGYITRDATDILVIEAETLAAVPPPVTVVGVWPPLAIRVELWDAAGSGAPRRAGMARADGPKTSFFGRINDKPAGAAYVGIHDDIAMLHALEVAPGARRRGLAAIMMRAAADWAQNNGATWLSVLVTQENESAQALYASLGLRRVGTYVYREKSERSETP